MGQLKPFSKGAHDREVQLPIVPSVTLLSLTRTLGNAFSPYSVSWPALHPSWRPPHWFPHLKSLGCCPLPRGPPPITKQPQKQMLSFGAFQNSSESGWFVLAIAFLPPAAPSSAHHSALLALLLTGSCGLASLCFYLRPQEGEGTACPPALWQGPTLSGCADNHSLTLTANAVNIGGTGSPRVSFVVSCGGRKIPLRSANDP